MNWKKIAPFALPALVYTINTISACAQNGTYNPPLGTKTLYVAGKDTAAPAPAGYVPFFINYIGRHGARHATGTTELQRLDTFLQEAANAGALLPDGQRLQGMIKILLGIENKYPAGRLTAIGEAEQFRIGQDMGQRYPDVVRQPGDCLQVMSTSEVRTVQSADQFLKGLASQSSCISRTPDDSIRLRFFSLSPAYRDYEKKGAWKQAQARLESAGSYQSANAAILHRLFDSVWATKLLQGQWAAFKTPGGFTMAMYAAAVLAPGLKEELHLAGYQPEDVNIFSLLSPQEAAQLDFVDAARDYFVKGPGLDAEGIQVRVAAPLLADFIVSSDQWLADGKKGADLRFAHAETIAPLAAIMGCEGADSAVTDPFHYAEVWRSDRLMGYSANIQWVFYRRDSSSRGNRPANVDDCLLKVLYNERPIHLPVPTGQYPYYSWKQVREYYLHKLYTLDAGPGRDMYTYLRSLK